MLSNKTTQPNTALALPLLCALLATCLWGCASDDAIPINPDFEVDLGEDFDYMLFTRSGSSSNGFVTGFDTLPSGVIDVPRIGTTVAYRAISGGVAFQNFVVNQQKLGGGAGYQKVVLNQDASPQEGIIVETFGGGSSIVFASRDTGYYVDFNTLNIQVMDPSSFRRLGEIAMDEALIEPANDANYYNSLYIRGDKMFACLYTGRTFPPFVYESDRGAIVAVVDLKTNTYQKSITMPGTKYPGQPFLRFQGNSIDEAGNLYLPTQGSLGLQVPGEKPTPAQILKIPAGMDEFDPDYAFIPQRAIASAAAEPVVNAGFLYVANGIAYTNVLMQAPAMPADLVNKPLMRWVRIDLANQTAQLVEGIPPNAGLTAGMAYHYNGKVQLTVYNVQEGINAIYQTDPEGTTAEKLIDVTAGGIIYGLYEVLETQ